MEQKEKIEKSFNNIQEWELAIIDIFVRAAGMIGFRKSVGMVYGMLYCSQNPRSISDLQHSLQLSRGAVVEAIQLLRKFGAVRSVLVIGERKDFYAAETKLKHLAGGFLREEVKPSMQSAKERLEQAESLIPKDKVESKWAKESIDRLKSWNKQLQILLPLAQKLFGVS